MFRGTSIRIVTIYLLGPIFRNYLLICKDILTISSPTQFNSASSYAMSSLDRHYSPNNSDDDESTVSPELRDKSKDMRPDCFKIEFKTRHAAVEAAKYYFLTECNKQMVQDSKRSSGQSTMLICKESC